MRMAIGFPTSDEAAQPAENPLETGFINEGCASHPTGVAWYDSSKGTSYGDGHRFESEETAFMTKVPSKHDKTRGE